MPERDTEQATNTDPSINAALTVVAMIVVAAFVTAVLARAAGMSWERMLHWTGEVLLLLGIGLAAKGISDVRREWTRLPDIWGRAVQTGRALHARAAAVAWPQWNRFVERSWVARRLRLRPHREVITGSGSIAAPKVRISGSGTVAWGVAPTSSGLEERVAWLEKRMQTAGGQIGTLFSWHEQEVRERKAATEKEHEARMAETRRIRERMADLAGGGLRLQAWGVACLLLGTVLTAFW